MFNIANWLWPQWTVIIMWGVVLLVEASLHGKLKSGEHHIINGIIRVGLAAWIFTSGGFFK